MSETLPVHPYKGKGRQGVSPGCHCLSMYMKRLLSAFPYRCGQKRWTIVRICRGREDTSHELRETRWEKPQKHHVGLVGWLGQPSWPISNQRCLSAWLSSEEKVPRRHHEEVQSRTCRPVVCVCVFLFNGRELVPITRVPPIPCWDKGRQGVSPGFLYLFT